MTEQTTHLIDWGLRVLITAFFAGITVRSVAGWIQARTQTHKASDQSVTLAELMAHCRGEHQKLESAFTGEVAHVRELAEKELGHGATEFGRIFKELRDIRTTINAMSKELTTVIAKANGKTTPKSGEDRPGV